MKWKTKISTHKDGELYVRGEKLTSLLGKTSFSEAIILLLRGTPAEKNESKMMDAILVSCIEHGVEAPSAYVPRVIASTGNSMNAALAGGLLAIGEHHGGAIEKAAKYLQSEKSAEEIVKEALEKKERLAGFGHKIYKTVDPRSEKLFQLAGELNFGKKYIDKAISIGEELEKQSGKKLVLNIDMAIAALISALGFDYRIGKAIFALGRLPGMIAHSFEELTEEKPYRRFEEGDVEYEGNTLK